MNRYFLLAITTFLFWGCENNANLNNEILFEEYYVRYLEAEKELKAYATFLEGDSLQNAKPKIFFGGIAFQNSGMEVRNLPKGVVKYSITNDNASYSNPFTFKYRNEEGVAIEEVLEMKPLGDFFVKDNISLSKGMTLVINDGSLSEDEQLVLLFSDEKNRAFSIPIMGPSEQIEYTFTNDQIQNLSEGKGQLYIVKKQSKIKEGENRSVSSNIEFYSKTLEIYIEK